MNQRKIKQNKNKKFIANVKIPDKKKSKFPIDSLSMETLRSRQNEKIIFSFRFLDFSNPAFNLGGICEKWYPELFNMLSDVSKLNRNELIITHDKVYRCHRHDWDSLDYTFNFDDEFLKQIDCRQIRIAKSKGGIHGILIGNTFYIVWIDPHHNLYPDERYGGRKFFSPPETCCSHRDSELEKLKQKNEELMLMLDECTS